MRHFCSYFDHHYLPRALALYDSLRLHAGEFTWHALCLDEDSHAALQALALPGVRLLRLDILLAQWPELAALRDGRSRLGFYFTLTPALLRWLMEHDRQIDTLVYLDADLYFFADPAPVWQRFADCEIGIIEHRFPDWLDGSANSGRFNVGLLWFRRGETTRLCLERWFAQCVEWCEDAIEGGRFGDQKYLDEWPERYAGLCILDDAGANVAPWNLGRHVLRESPQGSLLVDGEALKFFHFHAFRRVWMRIHDPGLRGFQLKPDRLMRKHIFRPYAAAIRAAIVQLQPWMPEATIARTVRQHAPRRLWLERLRRSREALKGWLVGDLLLL